MTKIVCIICALDIEYENIIKHLPSYHTEKVGSEFEIALGCDNEYLIAKCGVGKIVASKCTEYIISNEISFVISAGIAGALSPALDIGDIVVGKR